jgi:hypothetical protein
MKKGLSDRLEKPYLEHHLDVLKVRDVTVFIGVNEFIKYE